MAGLVPAIHVFETSSGVDAATSTRSRASSDALCAAGLFISFLYKSLGFPLESICAHEHIVRTDGTIRCGLVTIS